MISRMMSGVHSTGGAPWWPSTCTRGATASGIRLRAGEQTCGRGAGCLSSSASLPRLLISALRALRNHAARAGLRSVRRSAACRSRQAGTCADARLAAHMSPGMRPLADTAITPASPAGTAPSERARLVVEALTPPGVLLPPGARGGGVVAGGRGDRHVRVGCRVAKLLPCLGRHALYSQPCARGAHCLRAPIMTQYA
jgi:hypothetical protein